MSRRSIGLGWLGAAAFAATLAARPLSAASTATLARRALDAYRRGDFAAAAKDLEVVHKRRPGDPVVAYDLLTAYAAAGRTGEARSLLGSVAGRDPALAAVARYQLGTLALRQGRYEEAIEELTESLRGDPKSLAAKRNLEIALGRRPPRRQPPQPGAAGQSDHRPSPAPRTAPDDAFRKKAGMTRAEAEALLHALEAESPTNRSGAARTKGERDW
jgi:tetratricopeptide (TPR) repeat protein